jgi:hypothetical protein
MLVGPLLSQHCIFLVVAGGDYFQIWRVAMNILNKQSWTADKGSLQLSCRAGG